jgi:hypothetical protein
MKRVILLLFFVFIALAFATAQSYVPTTDVLGAHNNGGRGCAGCHAPHSGAFGAGGGVGTGQGAVTDVNTGNDALFGQDLGPLYGYTLNMGDSGRFVETLPASTAFAVGDDEIRGIMMCLSCHDGNVARGAMMNGQSYEQRLGLLPAGLYGSNPIPTLLGNDGTTAGNYNNDHPVGVNATLKAVHLVNSAADTTNLTITFGTGGTISNIQPTSGSTYANFVADYGAPVLMKGLHSFPVANPEGNTDPTKIFITCTTCHNQHMMNVFQSPYNATSNPNGAQIANDGGGKTYRTYFFVNAPYNPGATASATNNVATTTAQFCRQCHFAESNESVGLNLPTAFQ